MAESFDYVVLGGGTAAGYACREFAAQGVGGGRVAVITAELVLPYERPALTKAYLHPPGAKVRARLPGFHTCVGSGGERQTEEWYEKHGIRIIKGQASSVDLKAKTVQVGEERFGYGKLLLATGCRAMKMSRFGVRGDDLPNVFYLRQESEAAQLVQALEALGGKGQAVIVGGGYMGLECAAALKGWGLETTMVFPHANVMPRLFTAEIAAWLEEEYAARGIRMIRDDSVAEFVAGDAGGVASVRLGSGLSLPCAVAVVGVGAEPNIECCYGLQMDKGGFAVNSSMRTSDPDVYAIGDVCAFPSIYGGTARCEHVDHARRSAAQAVRAAVGKEPGPYEYVPYYYSRVFEYSDAPVVFNFFGDDSGKCQVCSTGDKSIGAIWAKDGKIFGALLMGSPGPSPEDAARLRAFVTERVPVDRWQSL